MNHKKKLNYAVARFNSRQQSVYIRFDFERYLLNIATLHISLLDDLVKFSISLFYISDRSTISPCTVLVQSILQSPVIENLDLNY